MSPATSPGSGKPGRAGGRRVVITGAGIVSPIGNDMDSVKAALLEGKTGVKLVPEWRSVLGLRSHVAGVVEGIDPKRIPRRYRRTMGRMAVLGTFAAQDAAADAGLDEHTLTSERTGIMLASTTGSPAHYETFFGNYVSTGGILGQEGTLFMRVMSHTVAANVAAVLGVRGRVLAPCAACASSTQAIGIGFETIKEGHQDVVLCGGAEELHPVTAGIFDVVHAASRNYNDTPERTPRPFDRDRDGLVVGEGAAVVVLEEYNRARQRGARIRAELLGWATGCDSRHMTQPSKEGMLLCMQQAARSAGISATELDYICGHATGTPLGDVAEAEATRAFAGDAVPISSLKGYMGHTLAACGSVEVICCLLMLQDGFLAPTRNLDNVAEGCDGIAHVREVTGSSLRAVMSSNFAFGGVNASLVLGKM